jgi:phage shock protein PspC (stress-responsive transcriptional regulator)
MDKTIKINLAGILFQIDEAAYHILRDYLQAIDKHFHSIPGGNETIEDIESRIAEIFRSQQNIAGIISAENVKAMISIMGNPEDFDHMEAQQETGGSGTTTTRRRLYRNPDEAIIAGVCGGIGAYANMDPVWVRLAFILAALFFGAGIFIYLALWIALPGAYTESRKRELYGNSFRYRNINPGQTQNSVSDTHSIRASGDDTISRAGEAFNEVFRALGKFFFIFFRIFMIITGISFVITGFTVLLVFIIGFFFKYPVLPMGSLNENLFYFPDLLNCVVNPSLTPWIVILTVLAVVLPLAAIIYWGIRMIFWFRVKDGILSLVFLVIWVSSITALIIILFNEGVSFSQPGRSISREIFISPPDTLHIITGKKAKDMEIKKEISLPDNYYTIFIGSPDGTLSVRAKLYLTISNEKTAKVEIRKRSFGRTKIDAVKKAESLIYSCRISRDSLFLDEYFTIPSGNKWTGDELSVDLFLPENAVLHFDSPSEYLLTDRLHISKFGKDGEIESDFYFKPESWQLGDKFWILTEDGLKETERAKPMQK